MAQNEIIVDSKELETLKLYLQIAKDDNSLDDLLTELLKRAKGRVVKEISKYSIDNTIVAKVTDYFDYMPIDLAIIRFNRIGSEGYKSETVSGHSVTFDEKDFTAYASLIADYFADKDEGKGEAGRIIVY